MRWTWSCCVAQWYMIWLEMKSLSRRPGGKSSLWQCRGQPLKQRPNASSLIQHLKDWLESEKNITPATQVPVTRQWPHSSHYPSEPFSECGASALFRRGLCQADLWAVPAWRSLCGVCPCGQSGLKWINPFSADENVQTGCFLELLQAVKVAMWNFFSLWWNSLLFFQKLPILWRNKRCYLLLFYSCGQSRRLSPNAEAPQKATEAQDIK